MRLLLIDNNDSFTYNIVDILRTIKGWQFEIASSGLPLVGTLHLYDKIVLSPGPGKPSDFPAIEKTITYCTQTNKALLGICLGYQAICEYFGGELIRLKEVVHGQKKSIMIDNTSALYKNLPPVIDVGLYHSWAIDHGTLPGSLNITGETHKKELMSVKHTDYNIYGVQFHPESFMTKYGRQIIENFLSV